MKITPDLLEDLRRRAGILPLPKDEDEKDWISIPECLQRPLIEATGLCLGEGGLDQVSHQYPFATIAAREDGGPARGRVCRSARKAR